MNISPRYAVYHAVDPLAMAVPQPAHWQTNRRAHFRHVADVVAPLEQVFALTNQLDHEWTANQEVIWHDTGLPLRSTSVGDVIASYETGQAWLIMPAGLQLLSYRSDKDWCKQKVRPFLLQQEGPRCVMFALRTDNLIGV